MNKVLVFAVSVMAIGLLFSCSSDTKPEEDISGQTDSSSSGDSPLSSSPNGGASSSSSLSGGSLLSSSSNGRASSSSSLPPGMVFCELWDGTCPSTPISQEECYYSGTPVQSCAGSSSSNGEVSSDDPLNCGTVPSSGNATSPITPPALICGNGETPTSIRWLAVPAIDWNNPKGGTYSDIGVMANCGTETDLMAFCSGTLTVRHVLSCSMPDIGYTGEAIKPVLSCSDGSVPSGIVFSGYLPNWDNLALGSYAVLAEANCGQGTLSAVSCGTLTVNPASCSGGGDNTPTHYCSEGTMKRYVILNDTRDNKTYKAVVIGTQTWMAENLNHYISGSKCYDDSTGGDSQNRCSTYGRLYKWETAMNNSASSTLVPSGVQGICPNGWHLPSKAEWEVMTDYIGGADTEGKKLKATSSWSNINNVTSGNGIDDYGFSALSGGYGYHGIYCGSYCGDRDFFDGTGSYGFWWSTSDSNEYGAYYRDMSYNGDNARWDYGDANWKGAYMSRMYSVRCLQD